MPQARNVLAEPVPPELRPQTCQAGHAIVWLLDGTEANGDGCLLGACACALRHEDNHAGRMASMPSLWRYVPPRGLLPGRLTPFFPSMNRVAFALAVRLYRHSADQPSEPGPPANRPLPRPMPDEATLQHAAALYRQATAMVREAPGPSVGPVAGPEAG